MDRPAHRAEGHGAVLQRHDLPPRHRRVHDSGRRSARPGHRRPRLQVRRRVQPEAPARQGRRPVDGQLAVRTPTAASSSSRWWRRPGSTTSTACSARSVEGMDVVNKIGKTPTSKPGDRPLKPITIESVTIETKVRSQKSRSRPVRAPSDSRFRLTTSNCPKRRVVGAARRLRGDSSPCASDSGVLAFAVGARARRRPARSALDRVHVVVRGGEVQRAPALRVGGVDVGAVADQQPGDELVVAGQRGVQRRVAVGVARSRRDVGIVREQQLGDLRRDRRTPRGAAASIRRRCSR